MIKIITQNVRGLQNTMKRKAMFNHLRNKCDILCIQETHCSTEYETYWKNEWGGKAFWSNKDTKSRGVAILISPKCNIEVIKTFQDKNGRVIGLQYKENEELFALVNIYAPNDDDPNFFLEVFKLFEEHEGKRIIIGDFNVALNCKLDREPATSKNNEKARNVIDQYMQDTFLEDVWRCRNPSQRTFTWCKMNPKLIGSRLDNILIETSFTAWVEDCKIIPGFKSDHSAVYIKILPFNIRRGKGMWKLNNRILSEVEYLNTINQTIEDAKQNGKHLNDHELWETTKLHIIANTQSYCYERAHNRKIVISQLEEMVAKYNENIVNLTDPEVNLMKKTKLDLEQLIQEKAQGAIFRSQATWYNEAGSTASKYFFGLEKARSGAKNMNCIILDNGDKITNPKKVIQEQKRFYEKLYKKEDNVTFDYVNKNHIYVSPEINETLAGLFTMQELTNAVKQLKRNKAPGCDGLTAEFYCIFFAKLNEILLNAINFSYKEQKLFQSALRGVINLIPKKSKDSRKLKHLRPISLLNNDYKLVEKMLANRIKPALEVLINYDQKGFMSNRRICCNIRRVLDIIEKSEDDDYEGVIVSVDFQKCFDRISIDALLESMRYFQIHEEFVKWTKIIYTDPIACIINNGDFSEYFNIERSVKQGGPCSAYFFLILAEVLAIELRDNKKIIGFTIADLEKILGQYADDMDMYLLGKESVIKAAFETISHFEKRSGFLVNYDKTSIYRIGSLKNSEAKLYTARRADWDKEQLNILGVEVTNKIENLIDINYYSILEKSEAICKQWKKRGLSLISKVTIVNTLIASLFVYRMTVLPLMPEKLLKRFNKMISKFLWDEGVPKIALKTLQANRNDGGLGLVNLKLKDMSLKASWVQIVKTDKFLEEFAYARLSKTLREKIWLCNLSQQDIKKCFRKSFWKDVLLAWSVYNYDRNVDNQQKVLSQMLWYNSHLRVNGEVIINTKACQENLFYISQLTSIEGGFLPPGIISQMFGIDVITVNSIISMIPKAWKKLLANISVNASTSKYEEFNEKKKCVSFFYKSVNQRDDILVNYHQRFIYFADINVEFNDYCEALSSYVKLTANRKLQSFQYRMLMSSTVLNTKLKKWKIKNSDQCTNCNLAIESVKHFFWECYDAKRIWTKFIDYCKTEFHTTITLNYENILLNTVHETKNNGINFMCLIVKQYMYKMRCKNEKANFYGIEKMIDKCKAFELYFAQKQNKLPVYINKWLIVKPEKNERMNFSGIENEFIEQYMYNL